MKLNWKDAATWSAVGGVIGLVLTKLLSETQITTAASWGDIAVSVGTGLAAGATAFVMAMRKK